MITYFVHSTSKDNEARVRAGWNDPVLSEVGRKQAQDLSEQLKNHVFDAVFTSDLSRTMETAAIALPKIPSIQDPRLREMNYGELNGKSEEYFPEDQHWCIQNRYPSGESCVDVQTRVKSFLDDHHHVGRHIAIVSHKYPQLALEVLINGLSWEQAIDSDWRTTGAWQAGWSYDC